jgi:bacillithiol system protein YtxJ
MPETILHTTGDFDAALRANRHLLLFKHSPACPISAAARDEYDAWRATEPALQTAFVDVIADRAVARSIASTTGVRHESPQAILFAEGRPAWHASHGAITAAALAEACRGMDPGRGS